MSIHRLSALGLILLTCLLSADGRTVYDIPSLKADLGFKPPKTTEFDFTAKVILPCTTAEKDFFVTDGTNSIRLVNETHRNAFSVGDLVHVQGRIRPKGNPDCLSIEVVGKGQPESIEELSIAEFLRVRHDQRLVRVRGRVRSVQRDEIDPEWVFVTLSDGSAVMQADLRPSADDFRGLQKLVDAEVGVLGIATDGRFTRGMNRQLNPSTLVTRSLSNFQVLRPAPADPFSVPPIDESDVFPGRNEYQRRSAVGHVLVTYDGNHLILRTEQGASMNVELAESTPPAPGARIRVVGHPATDLYRFNLTDAIWRTEPGEPMPPSAAEEISLDDLLTDGHGRQMIKHSYHGRVIRIRGIVRILPGTGNAGSRMVLEGGSSTIPVDIGACPQVLADLMPDCEVAVTGICVMPTPNWHPNLPRPRIREVFVALQSPDGLKVLRRPPWWTPPAFSR